MSNDFINSQPSPSILVQSLRDIGYSMESAIADIIDNSITAKAENIHIKFSWNDGEPWLAVLDDGHGMTANELTRAMKLGSKNPLDERGSNDLGRFGLGLKTASFSQCCKLTLVSCKDGMFSCREWDLDLINNDPDSGWRLRIIKDSELEQDKCIATLISNIQSNGTLVLWRHLDRYDDSEKQLNSLIEDTRKHLELVFHRFLSPSPGKRKISISLNNALLEAFNPFNSAHPATQELPEQSIYVENCSITVQPYVLPHYNKTSRYEYEKYSGEGGYLQNQGFYVYRNKRLIIKGTWFRLIKKEELTKLIRVQVDLPNSLDHLWKIDIKKSHASPPETIRKELKKIIDKISLSGKRVYQQRGKKLLETVKVPSWIRTAAAGKITYTINQKHPLISQLNNNLSLGDQQKLKDLITMLESCFPTALFYSDIAKKPESLRKPEFGDKDFDILVDEIINYMRESKTPNTEIAERLLSTEPFSSYPEKTTKILHQKGLIT
ncbi:ATP-binding protein [Candidatus Venteria ishoeyi]|uniref:DNA mismatch repair protein n=1 Tax=Candidatus Venteria ishoeyi TaxID=1899563 RepID=A0A1H6F434_9GAMM|nr:ATP-binding protein [Candidatus Venteria ishoeyi]SEH04938.1 DNA mismatch repair protein [Candidatus Venteria ishoeyi]